MKAVFLMKQTSATPIKKKENLWINLGFNIAAPILILSKLSGDEYLGPTVALIVALAFPISYGIYDFVTRKKVNIFSILGFVSTLLTGTISLMKLPPEYLAVKEAAIPGVLCILVFLSTKTPYSLVEKIILNDSLFDIDKLNDEIKKHDVEAEMETVMNKSSYIVAASFALSSVLNYFVTIAIVTSPPGTEAYNQDLADLQMWSYVIIALPSSIFLFGALFYLFKNIHRLTEKDIEEFIIQ